MHRRARLAVWVGLLVSAACSGLPADEASPVSTDTSTAGNPTTTSSVVSTARADDVPPEDPEAGALKAMCSSPPAEAGVADLTVIDVELAADVDDLFSGGDLWAGSDGFVLFRSTTREMFTSPDGRTWEVAPGATPAEVGVEGLSDGPYGRRSIGSALGVTVELRGFDTYDGRTLLAEEPNFAQFYDLCLPASDGGVVAHRLPWGGTVKMLGGTDDIVVLVVDLVAIPAPAPSIIVVEGVAYGVGSTLLSSDLLNYVMAPDAYAALFPPTTLREVLSGREAVAAYDPDDDEVRAVDVTTGELVFAIDRKEWVWEYILGRERAVAVAGPIVAHLAWTDDPAKGWWLAALPGHDIYRGRTVVSAAIDAQGVVVLSGHGTLGRWIEPEDIHRFTGVDDVMEAHSERLGAMLESGSPTNLSYMMRTVIPSR